MSTENSLIDAALRVWKSNVERVDNLFGTLSLEQLEQQVTPGKNRLIYLWGHLTAVNDGLLPLLGIGERFHPELDAMFISKPDRSIELAVTAQSLKAAWDQINQTLWQGFSNFCLCWMQSATFTQTKISSYRVRPLSAPIWLDCIAPWAAVGI